MVHYPLLFVDDDPILRRALARRLHDLAWVEGSASGAMEALERLRFGAILCDLDLGSGPNGVDVLRRARACQPEAVRWLTTGRPRDAEARRTLADATACRLVPKPWVAADWADLLGVVQRRSVP